MFNLLTMHFMHVCPPKPTLTSQLVSVIFRLTKKSRHKIETEIVCLKVIFLKFGLVISGEMCLQDWWLL